MWCNGYGTCLLSRNTIMESVFFLSRLSYQVCQNLIIILSLTYLICCSCLGFVLIVIVSCFPWCLLSVVKYYIHLLAEELRTGGLIQLGTTSPKSVLGDTNRKDVVPTVQGSASCTVVFRTLHFTFWRELYLSFEKRDLKCY